MSESVLHFMSIFGLQLGLLIFAFMLWKKVRSSISLLAWLCFLAQLLASVAAYFLPSATGVVSHAEVQSSPLLIQTMSVLVYISRGFAWVGIASLIVFAHRLQRSEVIAN